MAGACMARGGGHAWLEGVCVTGGHAWQAGHAWQRGGMHGEGGHAWQRGACMARGACVAKGGMHGKRGVCMAIGGMCGKRGGMCGMHAPLPFYEIRLVNARVVRILLECILVSDVNLKEKRFLFIF